MTAVPARAPLPAPDLPLLLALYALEASVAGAALLLHKRAGIGMVAVFGGLAAMSAAVVLARCLAGRGRAGRGRRLGLTVALNLVPVILALAPGELAVRALARPTPRGLAVLGEPLLPWQWADAVAHNRAILARAAASGSYLVADDRLGWVVGRSRRSADGRYFSSAEGLRSAEPGAVLADRPARQRVALMGDSFTFGLEVAFEDTWGHRLAQVLGPEVQVLNFGVDGYGVDQAYLRYLRDARPWRPDVAVLGLINHDLFRSLAVYSFVSFPGWPFPFAKPRFTLEGDRLALLNVPLPSPADILAAPSIEALPFVTYDPGYRAEDWRWHPLDRSYLYRYAASAYRRWAGPDARRADAAVLALNRALVRAFVTEARAAGAIPLVLYFPSDRDFRMLARDPAWRSLAQTTLRASGVRFTDLTPCLGAVPAADRFGPGHYSARGNRAVAECLVDDLRALLRARRAP
jgi:hypothetical protein